MKSILIRSIFAATPFLFCVSSAQAQTFPGETVTLMVPYPPGGPADALARIVARPLAQILETTLIVENMGGAGGALGGQKALAQPADGNYLLQASPNEVILAPALNSAIKLKADDFRLLRPVAQGVLALVTRSDLPARDADELIKLAEQRGDNTLTYGSVGVGTLNHLVMEDIQRETGVEFVHVPYKGNNPLLQDLVGGQIDVAVLVYSASLGGLAEKGAVRVIGQLGEQRSKLLPEVPTLAESRALRSLHHTTWAGIMVRKDTPTPIVQRLNDALSQVLRQQSVRQLLADQTLDAVEPMSLESVAAFYQREIDNYGRMLSATEIKVQ